ncbi:unnamed protein product [Peniophora sp. CBMAI 1063]|nr:unnamed protein product [Peniophora sp. CBMAI 1063]
MERGIDTSVTKIAACDPLVKEAYQIFERAHKAGDELPDEVTWDSVFKSHESENTTYWLCNVYDQTKRSFHRVLTYRVHTSSLHFIGRGTQGFVGVDVDEKAVTYMKRSWRIDPETFPIERGIYASLEFATEGDEQCHKQT